MDMGEKYAELTTQPCLPSSLSDLITVKDQRDAAMQKVEQLTTKLNYVYREKQNLEKKYRQTEKRAIKLLQTQLKGILKDRNDAVKRAENIEKELQELRLQRKDSNDVLNTHRIKKKIEEGTGGQIPLIDLFGKIQESEEEKLVLSRQLQQVSFSSKEERERADALNKLVVSTQRRKER